MSSRSYPYSPRKRPRGGTPPPHASVFPGSNALDFYNGGDRYNRPAREEGILTRLRKDFISLADPVGPLVPM
jgi:hypothetical protein